MISSFLELDAFCLTFRASEPLVADDIRELSLPDALDRYGVVVLRGCKLSLADLTGVARILGIPTPHTLTGYSESGFPEVMILSNRRINGRAIGVADPGRIWHSDSSFLDFPPAYTLLYSIEVPARGGETLFIDMRKAYRSLDPKLKEIVDNASGIFSYRPSYEAKRRANPSRRPLTRQESDTLKDTLHPLRLIHPRTGICSLYVNEAHAIGVADIKEPRSKIILQELIRHSYDGGPDYIHKWQVDDLIIWDNRSVIHRGTAHCSSEMRYVQRISIQESNRP